MDSAVSTWPQARMLATNRAGWERVAPQFFGGTALPEYGPLAPTEASLRLLDPVAGRRVLEIGCGSGHSLAYLAEQGAAELWGLDLSAAQIAFAAEVLRPYANRVRLFEAAMEVNPGLPLGYFDLVISIFGLGWTTDLAGTLGLIASYLKPGGSFIFSWEHPLYSRLQYAEPDYFLATAYHHEGPVLFPDWRGVPIVIQLRRVSTFVNGVIEAGLCLERLVEPEVNLALAKDAHQPPQRWYSVARAQMAPTTLILKARKPEGRAVSE